MASYDLGAMTGGRFHQYANRVGQVYYVDTLTNATRFSIPRGLEDAPSDTWTQDMSRNWPQWKNDRTGRAVLIDPYPPPPQTYLDDLHVQAAIGVLVRMPESEERLYQRPIEGILRFMFPKSDGYEVFREAETDFAFKLSQRTRATSPLYDFMLIESKKSGVPWGPTEDHLLNHLAENGNVSKNCYGMVQIGLDVQYYKYEGGVMSHVGGRMHLITHVQDVMDWGRYIKNHPMPFV